MYSLQTPRYTIEFWEKLNICLEKASEYQENIILVGDINENQLNIENNKFRDIMMINNMSSVINDATRITHTARTLLDLITNSIFITPVFIIRPHILVTIFATYLPVYEHGPATVNSHQTKGLEL